MSNFILLASSCALTAFPVNFYVIVFARFFAGIAHGLVYVTIIGHLSENCTKWLRGFHGTFNFLCLQIGLIVSLPSIIAYGNRQLSIHPWRINGGVCCFLSVIAIICTLKFTKESVVDLIKNGRDQRALRTLQYLRGEKFETTSIRDDFDDFKVMIIEDKMTESNSLLSDGNVRPLMLTLLLKISFVLSFNNSLNMIRLNVYFVNDFLLIWMLFPRIVIGLIVIYTIENGRRVHYVTSSIAASVILTTLGILKLVQVQINVIDLIIFIAFEIGVSIGIGSVIHVYDAEAFRTIKKAKSIAFTSIVEQILQIILIFLANFIFNSSSNNSGSQDDEAGGGALTMEFYEEIFIFTSAFLLIAITIYMFHRQHLPETKQVSIRRTRNMFLST